MAAFKDKNGKWYVSFRFTDWKGERHQKLKRGFSTRKEALEWERVFLQQKTSDLTMTFEAFVEIYNKDMKDRININTWQTKSYIMDNKIMPYFRNKKMSEIAPKDIIQWQNELLAFRNSNNGKGYSPTYLKTIHNQLSTVFNHAVRYYDLKSNPAAKAGNMGKEETEEIKFWTREQYLVFSDSMMDKPVSFYAFEMLYWCGIRMGELLALTSEDFDFDKSVVSINKSYQRIKREDIIGAPKTPKSKRIVQMPDFLCQEMKEYISSLYGCKKTDRIFPISKSYLHHEMDRGCKEQNLDRITIHGIRHSHVSLLIEMGFSAVAIADRVGHESIDITYRYAHLFPSKQMEIADKLDFNRMERND